MRCEAGKERRGRCAAFPLRCLWFMPRDKLNMVFGRVVFLFGYQNTSQIFGKKFNTENPSTICPLVGSTYQGMLFFRGSEWAAECSTKPNSTHLLQSVQSSAMYVGVEGVEGWRAGWSVEGMVRRARDERRSKP